MRRLSAALGGLVLLGLGYVAGASLGPAHQTVQAAQEETSIAYSKDVLEAYKKATKAVRELNNLFVAGGQSTQVFGGMNYFAASVGGIDAEKDLEEGRGVDPETFAALYAGLASPRITEHLDFDQLGRLRYKKNVIRIYSQERLKLMFQQRDQLDVRSESAQ